MTDAEFHSQLASRGLPQPSAKAVHKKIEARPLISVKWWLERQALAEGAALVWLVAIFFRVPRGGF